MAIAKFNITGTHIQHRYLKVRVDIYPSLTDKTYALHYVDEVDEEGNPTGAKQLNPCLCHFIKIDDIVTRLKLRSEICKAFDKTTFRELDEALSEIDKPGRREKIRQLMRDRGGRGKPVPYQVDTEKLIKTINTRFKDLEVDVG